MAQKKRPAASVQKHRRANKTHRRSVAETLFWVKVDGPFRPADSLETTGFSSCWATVPAGASVGVSNG